MKACLNRAGGFARGLAVFGINLPPGGRIDAQSLGVTTEVGPKFIVEDGNVAVKRSA